jgi:hypothetical protein
MGREMIGTVKGTGGTIDTIIIGIIARRRRKRRARSTFTRLQAPPKPSSNPTSPERGAITQVS